MTEKQQLWYHILDQLSLELTLNAFLDVLEYDLLEYDLNKKKFKISIYRHVFDIEDLIRVILAKKMKCKKSSLNIVFLNKKEESKFSYGEANMKYTDALIDMYTYHQLNKFSGLNLVYIKYHFLKQVHVIFWQDYSFWPETYLLYIWWYIFNSFESVFVQLEIAKNNPNIKKKYKSWLILIFAMCFSLADGDDDSWNCWIWLEISLSRIKDAFLLITKEGFFGIEWLLEKRIPKKSITMVDCESANAIFIKCGLWYRFKIQNWFIKILMKN